MSIQIRNVSKQFGAFQALRDVSLDIQSGELIALLGPSGCGKTTLLRIIAGLEQPDSGSILFSGADQTDVHVRERGVGFVFQHYALFRHMTVFDNVAFGLRMKPRRERPSEAQIRAKVMELLSLVQLDWVAERYPSQLSGGQRQRIALARALAVEPQVLLLDEPFGALDAKVRKELRRWLARLGSRSLGALLFAHPRFARGTLQACRLDARHPLFQPAVRALCLPPSYAGVLWARRSLFTFNGRSLLVTEIFSPTIDRLSDRS